jgi:argininosuccinate lyase
MAVHNTPFGDIVDTEDDLQPLVDRMFHDTARALTLVGAALASASFDRACLERRAGEAWVTITELADTLVREHGLAFETAHGVARAVVAARAADPAVRLAAVVAEASRRLGGATVEYSDARLADILSPRHFVAVRTTHGGPSPVVTSVAIERSRQLLEQDRAWVTERRSALEMARGECRRKAEAL